MPSVTLVKGGPRWPGIQGGASYSTRTEGCPARNPSIVRYLGRISQCTRRVERPLQNRLEWYVEIKEVSICLSLVREGKSDHFLLSMASGIALLTWMQEKLHGKGDSDTPTSQNHSAEISTMIHSSDIWYREGHHTYIGVRLLKPTVSATRRVKVISLLATLEYFN